MTASLWGSGVIAQDCRPFSNLKVIDRCQMPDDAVGCAREIAVLVAQGGFGSGLRGGGERIGQ